MPAVDGISQKSIILNTGFVTDLRSSVILLGAASQRLAALRKNFSLRNKRKTTYKGVTIFN